MTVDEYTDTDICEQCRFYYDKQCLGVDSDKTHCYYYLMEILPNLRYTKMPELIDREATLKKMCEACGYCEQFEKSMRSTHPDFVADKCNIYKFIAEQPTIEAKPVRRAH